MRFGLILQSVWPPAEFVDLVRWIEEAGFEYLWLTDSSLHARYVYAYLALAASCTRTLKLGTGVTHPHTRHPALTASAIATVDEISSGRAILGVGAGDRPVTELGKKPATVAQVRDMIRLARDLFSGKTVDGPFATQQAALHQPARPIPIYTAASGERMLAMSASEADGIMLMATAHPGGVRRALAAVDAGLSGRSRSELDISWAAACCLAADRRQGIEGARPQAAWFAQTAPEYARLLGVDEDLVAAVRRAYSGGELTQAREAAQLCPDQLVQDVAVAGTSADAIRSIERMAETGLDRADFFVIGEDRRGTIERLGKEVLPAFR